MTKRLILPLLIGTAVFAATPAVTAPVPGFHHPPNIVHPDNDFASRRSGGLQNEWMFRRDWKPVAQSYSAALSFANCLNKYNPRAGEANLGRSAADPAVRPDLLELVKRHRACGAEQAMVAPVLLRLAFAEVALRSSTGARSTADIGVPRQIGAFPLAALAECQVRSAPDLSAALLKTRPGDRAEEAAAARLFAATPECSAKGNGAITPTAARLAIIDAAYRWGF